MATFHDFQLQAARGHGAWRSEQKPLLRGWSHALAAVASAIFTGAMLSRAGADPTRLAAALVFGGSMVLLYTVSALYHRWYWEGRCYTVLHTLDHANIFIKIAGSYTPFCLLVLGGEAGLWLLAVVWLLAAAGICGSWLALQLPRWAAVAQYLGMGWIAVALLPSIAAELSWTAVLVLVLSGLLYSAGGAIYALRRPDPIPHIFGYHEIFHLLVIAGNAVVAAVVWLWVL